MRYFSFLIRALCFFAFCASPLSLWAQEIKAAPVSTATPVSTPTSTATPVSTPAPSAISTPAPTPVSTATPKATPTATPKATPTAMPISTPQNATNSTTSVGLFLDASVPLSLRIKDLNTAWRLIYVNDKDSSTGIATSSATTGNIPLSDLMNEVLGAREGTYFTQWQTATAGNDSFLIVYRLAPLSQSDIAEVFSDSKKPPSYTRFMDAVPRWMGAHVLNLTLLNLKTVKIVDKAQPFNFNTRVERVRGWAHQNLRDVAPKNVAPPLPLNVADQQRADLRELALAVVLYAQDNDNSISPMSDLAAFKKAITPYVKAQTLAASPDKTFYSLNTILSGKKVAHISAPADMVTIYQTQPDKDNSRLVAFLDGHVRRLNDAQWLKYKRGSKIK